MAKPVSRAPLPAQKWAMREKAAQPAPDNNAGLDRVSGTPKLYCKVKQSLPSSAGPVVTQKLPCARDLSDGFTGHECPLNHRNSGHRGHAALVPAQQ